MSAQKREVFVMEQQGVPYRMARDDEDLLQSVAAGIRLGLPVGQERVVRYVPEPSPRVWIPCSERMPLHDEPVWFCLSHDDARAGWWHDKGNARWIAKDNVGGAGWAKTAVTHWMPRIVDEPPEPPHA